MRLRHVAAAMLILCCGMRAAIAASPVWIDTDAACGIGDRTDVDDCWALILALAAPELSVRGIGTVFGNAPGAQSHEVTRAVVARARAAGLPDIPVHRGADSPDDGQSAASRALSDALGHERLTIIALGPLTNIAEVLAQAPWRAGQIERILAVAGQRDRGRFHPGTSSVLHMHDLNLRSDPAAFAAVIKAGVPITLLPFELATMVTIAAEDLDRLADGASVARWLSGTSQGWLAMWRDWFGAEGFHPFDSLAVGYAIAPGHFRCQKLRAWIEGRPRRLMWRTWLLVGDSPARTPSSGIATVTYCSGVDAAFKGELVTRLASQ